VFDTAMTRGNCNAVNSPVTFCMAVHLKKLQRCTKYIELVPAALRVQHDDAGCLDPQWCNLIEVFVLGFESAGRWRLSPHSEGLR